MSLGCEVNQASEGPVEAVTFGFRPVRSPLGLARPEWELFQELSEVMGADMGFHSLDDVQQEMAMLMAVTPAAEVGVASRGQPPPNPSLRESGKNPFQLDSKAPSIRLKDYAYREARYTMLARGNPELAAELLKDAQDDVERQWRVYSARAAMPGRGETPHIAPEEKPAEKLEPVAAGGDE